jgi:hypothetical protein
VGCGGEPEGLGLEGTPKVEAGFTLQNWDTPPSPPDGPAQRPAEPVVFPVPDVGQGRGGPGSPQLPAGRSPGRCSRDRGPPPRPEALSSGRPRRAALVHPRGRSGGPAGGADHRANDAGGLQPASPSRGVGGGNGGGMGLPDVSGDGRPPGGVHTHGLPWPGASTAVCGAGRKAHPGARQSEAADRGGGAEGSGGALAAVAAGARRADGDTLLKRCGHSSGGYLQGALISLGEAARL